MLYVFCVQSRGALEIAKQGRDLVMEALLTNGADPKKKNKDGKTALHIVAEQRHDSVIPLLISHGADANQKDKKGKTPLHLAAEQRHDAAVVALIANGANLNEKDEHGKVPLDLAPDDKTKKALFQHTDGTSYRNFTFSCKKWCHVLCVAFFYFGYVFSRHRHRVFFSYSR